MLTVASVPLTSSTVYLWTPSWPFLNSSLENLTLPAASFLTVSTTLPAAPAVMEMLPAAPAAAGFAAGAGAGAAALGAGAAAGAPFVFSFYGYVSYTFPFT